MPTSRKSVSMNIPVWKKLNSDKLVYVLLYIAAEKSDTDKSAAAGPAAAAASSQPVIINTKSYQSRLGLARTLSRQSADLNEIKKLYIEAIDMAPNVSRMKACGVMWM